MKRVRDQPTLVITLFGGGRPGGGALFLLALALALAWFTLRGWLLPAAVDEAGVEVHIKRTIRRHPAAEKLPTHTFDRSENSPGSELITSDPTSSGEGSPNRLPASGE